ncbi:DUF6882 domain-containing protein [Ruania rhizosphaerae]|uniref:DUF6882 domain-containing protein n=1 Tax=Ruania rhizosphaerae TaxID=1840413 RepID=UPI00135BC329|nr:DUF6882 domain-containing protein [Ruania rhizosphaerae]
MARISSFQDVLDDSLLTAHDRQSDLQGRLEACGPEADRTWDVDLNARMATFTGPAGTFTATAHLLGSAAPGPGSWLWSWANPQYAGPLVARAEQVRRFGEQYAIPPLRDAEVPLDGEPRQVARHFCAAAGLICGGLTHYTLDAGSGTVAALLLESPELAPTPPSAIRAARVLAEVAQAGQVRNWDRAIRSYAQWRGFTLSEAPEGLTLAAPDGTATCTLDELGRLGQVKGNFHQA